VDALVLRHACFKINEYAHNTVSGKDVAHGLWFLAIRLIMRLCRYSYRRGSLVRWCQMRVRSTKMRVFSFDRCIFRMTFPTGFTYRNLHCFARFPSDSRAIVIIHLEARVLLWQCTVYADVKRMMINVKMLSVIVVNVLMTTSDDNYVTEMRRFMIQQNSWLQLLYLCFKISDLQHQILFTMCMYNY